MIKIKKAMHRLWRCLSLHRGIYGIYDKGNKFRHGVLIDEESIIGCYNYFGDNTHITKAIIGNYCSFAPNVTVGPGEHPYNNISTNVSIMEKSGVHINLTKENIIIKNDVWIGANAVLVRGITVGNGAVIAAGAIVTKDVPDYAIVGGVPAKIIKYRFNSDTIAILQNSKWFLKPNINVASKCVRELQNMIYKETNQ